MAELIADVDDDTMRAVQALWASDSANLPTLFTDNPKAGRLKSPQTHPYAKIESKLDHRELTGTGGAYFDWRLVTLSIYGLKEQVTQALPFVKSIFNLQLGKAGFPTLIYPSGASFLQWADLGDTIEQDPDTKAASDIWCAKLVGRVWSTRGPKTNPNDPTTPLSPINLVATATT